MWYVLFVSCVFQTKAFLGYYVIDRLIPLHMIRIYGGRFWPWGGCELRTCAQFGGDLKWFRISFLNQGHMEILFFIRFSLVSRLFQSLSNFVLRIIWMHFLVDSAYVIKFTGFGCGISLVNSTISNCKMFWNFTTSRKYK